MAFVVKDRVKETCTAPGTGTVTLLGASTGYQSFSVIGNGNTTYYCIADQGGANWEVGIGTYTSSGTTLSRDTVLSSSNGGSKTNFSTGTQDVFVTYPSERSVYVNSAGSSITPDVASTLATTYGGTGLSSFTANGVLYASSTSALATGSALTFDGTNFATTGTVSGTKLIPTGGAVTGNGMYLPAANTLGFTTNGAEALRIDSSGNVIVGTSASLGGKFEIYAPSAIAGNYQALQVFSNDAAAINLGGGISLGGYYGAAQIGQFASIWGRKENSTASNYSGYLALGTNLQGVGVTERMRIDSSGNLGLGVTPSAWGSGIKAQQIGATASLALAAEGDDSSITTNAYKNTSNVWVLQNTSSYKPTRYHQYLGQHIWYYGTSGSAGANATFTQAMTLDASGNLGIGTSSPSTFNQNQTYGVVVGTGAGLPGLTLYGGTDSGGSLNFADGTSGTQQYRGSVEYNHGSDYMAFRTTSTERMRIDSSGNVGIGTSSPSARLHIKGGNNNSLYIDNDGSRYTSTYILNNGTAKSAFYWDQTNTALYFGTSVSAPINFNVNGGTVMTLDSSGNLGLGVTPSAWGSAFKAIEGGDSDNQSAFTFQTNANAAGFWVNSYYNGTNSIYKYNGYATRFVSADGKHEWYTAPSGTAGNTITFTQAMTLDASGNLLVGTTTAPSGTAFRAVLSAQYGGLQLHSTVNTAGGGISTVPSGGGLNFYTYTGTVGSETYTERMRIDSSGNLLIGKTSATANGGVLQVSNGITFPATQSACSDVNTLDDYEEGTWTPAFASSDNNMSVTTQINGATYRKIGALVYISLRIYTSATSSVGTGSVRISGLPFTSATVTNHEFGLTVANSFRWNSNPPLAALIGSNSSVISLISTAYTTAANVTTTATTDMKTTADNNNYIVIAGCYSVAT